MYFLSYNEILRQRPPLMLKWHIWKRRNLYVYEGEFKHLEHLWRSFCFETKVHCEILIKVNQMIKKEKI